MHSGPAKGELEWRRPTRETLQNMLHNPAYAGYYAYGRRQVEPRRKIPGRPDTGRVVKDASEWLVLLPGRMPAYITPEEYEANVARMAANRQTAAAPGAPRDGAALLSGLLRCGRCGGHRMTVSYHDASARSAYGYTCAFYQVNYGTGGRCQHIAGAALDDYVARQVLDAVAPAALEVSMAAAAQAEDERAMLDKLWRQRLERARYAADRARRQYQLAEPENRLVTRQLEADWEDALAGTARLEAEYQRFAEEQPSALTAAERAAIQVLAADLPQVWEAASTTQADRKELLRILIEDITVHVIGDSELVDVTITWAGGHQTSGQAVRPVARLDQLSYFPALLARVTGLAAAGRSNRQIADVLNAEGFRPPKRTSRFSDQQVRTLISQRGIRAGPGAGPPCSPAWHRASGRSPACPPSWACPPPASTTGSTAAGSPPATPPEPGTGSSPPTRSRCASYASAGPARPATTPAPAGHRQNRHRNPTRNKEHSHEKAAQLDRCQRWPTSAGHLSPAALISLVLAVSWPSGT